MQLFSFGQEIFSVSCQMPLRNTTPAKWLHLTTVRDFSSLKAFAGWLSSRDGYDAVCAICLDVKKRCFWQINLKFYSTYYYPKNQTCGPLKSVYCMQRNEPLTVCLRKSEALLVANNSKDTLRSWTLHETRDAYFKDMFGHIRFSISRVFVRSRLASICESGNEGNF